MSKFICAVILFGFGFYFGWGLAEAKFEVRASDWCAEYEEAK